MREQNMQQVFLWAIAGSLVGLGLIGFDILFLSGPCLIVGVSLAIFGIRRWGAGYLWVAGFCLGAIPALLLLVNILSASACPAQGLTIPASAPAGTTVSCSVIPGTYYVLLVCFGLVAVVAGAWPVVRRYARRSDHSSVS